MIATCGVSAPFQQTQNFSSFFDNLRKEENTLDKDERIILNRVESRDSFSTKLFNDITNKTRQELTLNCDATRTLAESSHHLIIGADSAVSPYHVVPTANFDSSSNEMFQNDEERKLILASVRHVDCKDFPFDEVLSLEDTVKKGEDTQCYTARQPLLSNNASEHVTINQQVQIEIKCAANDLQELKRPSNNRPPLLKCSTWPKSEFPCDVINNKMDDASKSRNSRLDSPSFYSSTAIDFSAISHLSDEHDRIMAEEYAERDHTKPSYVSQSTKDKLYGKATQRRLSMSANILNNIGADHPEKKSYYSTSADPQHPSSAPIIIDRTVNSVIKSDNLKLSSNCKGSGKKVTKSTISPMEKEFRKHYSSFTNVASSSLSFPSVLMEEKAFKPQQKSESLKKIEEEEEEKKSLMLTEKQPLPPEGFKISRYPIKQKPQLFSSAIPTDQSDQKSLPESDLLQIIEELRKRVELAEGRATKAEKEMKEWKERAQETLSVAQSMKEHVNNGKIWTNQHIGRESALDYDVTHTKQNDPQKVKSIAESDVTPRWSNDRSSDTKRIVNTIRPRVVSADNVIGDSLETEGVSVVSVTNGRKRFISGENNFQMKRRRESQEKSNANEPKVIPEAKQKDTITWLANTIAPIPDMLSTPLFTSQSSTTVNGFNQKIKGYENLKTSNGLTSRSTSHEEVRRALRAKVEGTKVKSMSKMGNEFKPKFPLEAKDSFDQLLDRLTSSPIIINTPEEFIPQETALKLWPDFGDIHEATSPHLSDVEISSNDVGRMTDSPTYQEEMTFSRRSSSTGSSLDINAGAVCDSTEISNQANTDFLNQLGCLLDLC